MKIIQVLLNSPCASAFLQLYLGIVLAVVVCVTGLFSYYQVRISSGRCGARVIVVVCVCVCLSVDNYCLATEYDVVYKRCQ